MSTEAAEPTAPLSEGNASEIARLARLPLELLESALSMRRAQIAPSVLSDAIAREALRRIERRQLVVQQLSSDPLDPSEMHQLMTERSEEGAMLRKDVREEDRAIREDSRIVLQAIKDSHTYDGILSEQAQMTDDPDEADALTRKLAAQKKQREKMAKQHRKAMTSSADAASS